MSNIRLIFAYTSSVPLHSCLVSFTDSEGIEHSVRVPAESLFEAAVEAIAAFKKSVLDQMPLGPRYPPDDPREGPGGGTYCHGREGAFMARRHRGQPEREAEEESVAGTAEELSCSCARGAVTRGLTVRSRAQLLPRGGQHPKRQPRRPQ